MKNYLICAGGSGVRAMESVLNFCAAGLGPDEIKVLVIDPDASNGNYTRTNEVFGDYRDCCSAFRGNLGGERFFATKVSPLASMNGSLQAWSPVNNGQVFRDVLGFSVLTPRQQDVAKLMFTEGELNMQLNVGFKGHPALGAAALALLSLYGADPVWSAVGAQLTADLANGPVRVVIAGSVFGGTGASTFFPLARRLREIAGPMIDNLHIGVIAIAPYFTFPVGGDPDTADGGPDARKFPVATRAAAQFYHHLRTTGGWHFDAMFWLGDDKPADVVRNEGGEHQKNDAHFVDLLAALVCLDYFAQPVGATLGGACYFAGPEGDLKAAENVTTWSDLPLLAMNREEIRKRFLQFTLAGAMHLSFFREIVESPQSPLFHRPRAVPWYFDRFVSAGHPLNAAPHNIAIAAFSKFLLQRHFPWWRDTHVSGGGRVRLLNANSFLYREGPPATAALDLARLANLLHPDLPNPNPDSVHHFFCDTCARLDVKPGANAAADGAPAYVATLAHAATAFMGREYQGV